MLGYLIHLTLCWGLFALLYSLLLRQQTFFGANRGYLLGTSIAGLLLPVLNQLLPALNAASEGLSQSLPVFTVGPSYTSDTIAQWSGVLYLWWLYLAGVLFTSARMVLGLGIIGRMLIGAHCEYLTSGDILIRTNKARLPFSFFKWIFVPDDFGSRDSDRNMLTHEQAHSHALHSLDILYIEILSVIFWFHPLVHWYRRSLRTVHEYQADAAAASNTSRKQYGLLLIQQAQVVLPVAFVNHFFQSPLKKRLLMLAKNHSPVSKQIWKYILVLPLIAALWACTRTNDVPAQPATISGSGSVLELFEVDKLPEFPGGSQALSEYLGSTIKYPETVKRDGVEGVVAVLFVIDKDGQVTQVEAIPSSQKENVPSKANIEGRRELEAEAIRAVQAMPQWSPAIKNGEIVPCRFTLPIKFKLE